MSASGHPERVDDAELLAIAYRGRPDTVVDLATLSQHPLDNVRAVVARLRAQGLLGGRGEAIGYVDPAAWVTEAVPARARELRESTRTLIAQIERIEQTVADLPRMLAHWSVGEATADRLPVLTRHGPRAAEDLWYEIGEHGTGTLLAVLPDVSRFHTSSPGRVARASSLMRAKDAVRLIIPRAAIDEPGMAQLLLAFAAAGIEYRFLDEPPSWFWVDGDQLAVPFEWGEGRPTSVMGVRSATLAGMVRAYFELLWRAASPPEPVAYRWTPLLRLMRAGTTLEAASRLLGINPRTGRRWVAQAMAHHGVSTLFALGAAWAAQAHSRDAMATPPGVPAAGRAGGGAHPGPARRPADRSETGGRVAR